MTLGACPRLFEVEALRDGRLTGSERSSFERHLALCAECAGEADTLQALAAPLRAPPSGSHVDELYARRERTRLLAAFDRSKVAPERRGLSRWVLLAPALAVLAVLAFVLARPESEPVFAPRAQVQAQGPATWSRHVDAETERVILDAGTLRVELQPAAARRRFVVVLPDGELEDIGTTFTVHVADERTHQVSVQQGSVVLRLRGRSPISIGAGETWSNAPASAEVASSSPVPARAITSARLEPSARSIVSPWPAPSTSTADTQAARDFRLAVSALDAGNHAGAAAAFARFLGQHPRDARAEDAAYLRVIALQRAGDVATTRAAASDYLRRYAAGFRRAEVESLVRGL